MMSKTTANFIFLILGVSCIFLGTMFELADKEEAPVCKVTFNISRYSSMASNHYWVNFMMDMKGKSFQKEELINLEKGRIQLNYP